MSSIATRRGDDGTTGLLYGQRVAKTHPQIEVIGVYDELNAVLGLVRAEHPVATTAEFLKSLQYDLIALMGELACAEEDATKFAASKFSKIETSNLARIDDAIATLEARNLSFAGWATPGANLLSARFELARTVARRAERRLLALPAQGRHPRPLLAQYANRLADLLWLWAREAETLGAASIAD